MALLRLKNYTWVMGWKVVDGGPKGIRVFFADKTFVDFEKKHAQVLRIGDKNVDNDLEIGDWNGKNSEWLMVASFPQKSYLYVIQIP